MHQGGVHWSVLVNWVMSMCKSDLHVWRTIINAVNNSSSQVSLDYVSYLYTDEILVTS